MERREFLITAAAAPLAGLSIQAVRGADLQVPDPDGLFEASSSEVLALARRVMEKCVLEKIMPPPRR